MKKSLIPILLLAIFALFISLSGCRKPSADEEVQEEEQPVEAAEEPKPAPPPKMNEDVYVQIRARSALIYEKYKEDFEKAQKEVEALYEKFGVTVAEYKEFVSKLSPERTNALEKKIVEYMQKIGQEYR